MLKKFLCGTVRFVSLFSLSLPILAGESTEHLPVIDYFDDEFTRQNLLDWGDRPVWSPDGKRIAFTKNDIEDSPAYEIDVATREVRCLTCRWGANGLVTRIFYLADGSFLIEAGAGLENTTSQRGGGTGAGNVSTELYWMPADLSMPPHALQAKAIGDIAIFHEALPGGGTRLAWGANIDGKSQLIVADLVHNGQRAALTNRRIGLTTTGGFAPANRPTENLVSFPEAYDFTDAGEAVTFWTIEKGSVRSQMYMVHLETGVLTRLESDGAHNETHLFPDGRYGLEESNRASDPQGPVRGISGLPERTVAAILASRGGPYKQIDVSKNSRRPFDLFVVDYEGSKAHRRLTNFSHLGGEADQSKPAPDGRRIAFVVSKEESSSLTLKPGLYVGEFIAAK